MNLDQLKALEEKILGAVAWLTAHGNQLDNLKQDFDQTKAALSDAFKQLSALKEQVKVGASDKS